MARARGHRRGRPTATPPSSTPSARWWPTRRSPQTFMTACSPGIVASAMQNRHYAVAWRSTCGRWPPRCAPSTGPSSTAACCCRSTRPTSPSSATRCSPTARCRSSSSGSSWWSTPSTAPSQGIDPAEVRLHVCWGNYEGPHTHDVPFEDIQPLLYEANVGALVISMANARHAHEVRCFERRPLPDDMALVAGVIDTTSNYVEHPEVVADRIERAARGGRRPAPDHRRHRLRLRHHRRDRRRGPEPGVGEAAGAAGRRRPGVGDRASSRCGRRGCSSARPARRRRGRCRR